MTANDPLQTLSAGRIIVANASGKGWEDCEAEAEREGGVNWIRVWVVALLAVPVVFALVTMIGAFGQGD